jgi:succinoglycan biosynthesis protein ExoO
VGSAHLGNTGIKEFIRSSWPKIQGQVVQSRLKIYGGICNWLSEANGCDLMGNVEDIGRAYRDSALVICPVTAGSGLKIKLVEAFRHGRTAVTTPSGIEGCAGSVSDVSWVADVGAEFEHAIVDLLVSSDRRRRMESAAFAYAEQYYSIDALTTSLAQLLPRERTGPEAADLSVG